MKSQLLKITPDNVITFDGNFKNVITRSLTLHNPTNDPIAFKIKTTTPKQYCVRPSLGFVEPSQKKEILIMLQPLESLESDKIRHKFLIQSLVINKEQTENLDKISLQSNIETLWKNASNTDIMQSKLLSSLVYHEENIEVKEVSNDVKEKGDEVKTLNIEQPILNKISENSHQEFPKDLNDYIGDTVEHEQSNINTDKTEFQNEFLFDSTLMKENKILKEQILTLKRIALDNSCKMQSNQKTTEEYSNNESIGNQQEYGSISLFGMPLVVYLLIVFFIGLIIGKFFL